MGLRDFIIEMFGLSESRQFLVDNVVSPDLIASVLVVFAKSDGGISPEENLRMVQLLRQRHGLQPGAALELITRLAGTSIAHNDFERLLESANQEFSVAEKEELVLMVLKVIAADREKDADEMKLLSTLVEGLHISDKVMASVYERYFDKSQ